jgi:acyl transferase domain-containing protein
MSIQDILAKLRAGEISAEEAKAALQGQLGPAAKQATRQLAKGFREAAGASNSGEKVAHVHNAFIDAAAVFFQGEPQTSPLDPVAAASTHSGAVEEPIAVVGMSGRYPDAPDLIQYWENLLHGKDCVHEIPKSRWDVDLFFAAGSALRGRMYCRWLGALADVECFDPLFFSISPAEAEQMDPQHRLFMEEAYRACEDAGYGPDALSGTRCGVYLGVMNGEYSHMALLSGAGAANLTGNSNAIGAARISYHLNLRGPAIAVDTACSSSLVAVHLACQALRNNEIDMAIAGGAALYLSAGSYMGMCAAGMMSRSGRCRSFDNSADGFVSGEGAGALLLKRLRDAEAAQDTIHGLIIASGINHDGRTHGITAPSKQSQIELTREIYRRHDIDPATIGYVEMFGVGSKLGDAIELEALSTTYKERTARRNYCAIGSLKSNIGHVAAAAGVAGVQKVLLAMRHRMLTPTLHFAEHNEHFEFATSPFFVNTLTQPWPAEAGLPRRAAVSSFGFSGTNAHAVLEEYVDSRPQAATSGRGALFLLSARSPERLRAYARNLQRYLQATPDVNLQDVAFTLQVGRAALDHRLAIVADSLAALSSTLADHAAALDNPHALTGAVHADRPMQEDADLALAAHQQLFDSGGFLELGELWVQGLDIAWNRLRRSGQPRRVGLPTYPFEKGRYWLPIPIHGAVPTVPDPVSSQHVAGPTRDLPFRELVQHYVTGIIAAVLKLPLQQVDADTSLDRYGLDSLAAAQMVEAFSTSLVTVSSAIFLQYPSVNALTDYLIRTQGASLRERIEAMPVKFAAVTANPGTSPERQPAAIARRVPSVEAGLESDVAIIGVSGRYPGARNLDELWERLRKGEDCVTDVPASRWNHDLYFDPDKGKLGKSYCGWGGFIDGVDEFDPLFFDIPPRGAEYMDPQIRLYLQTVWELLESSGQTRAGLERRHGSRVGVYVGAMSQQYQMFDTDYVVHSGIALSTPAMIATRVSNFFNFRGPSIAVDTQCSSSLIAVHMACRALRDQECEVAIAGGINLLLHPKKYIGSCIGLALGSSRESRSFTDGDGYIPCEGVGAVLLKPLARAVEDGDNVLAVIKYSGQCHAGKGKGYGTQDPHAQFDMICTALAKSGIDARSINYLEASANGVQLSDATEAASLIRAFSHFTTEKQFCAVGSIKSNMGHLEAAAGIGQLTKVILQLRHKQIAPILFAESRNPGIDFNDSPLYLQTELADWQRTVIEVDGQSRELPRRAAINSFGGGGALAHVIVEEYVPTAADRDEGSVIGPQVIILSARTAERLHAAAEQLLKFLERAPAPALADVAWTLQIAREAMQHRLAFVVNDMSQLLRGLEEYLLSDASQAPVGDESAAFFRSGTQLDAPEVSSLLTGTAGETLAKEMASRGEWNKLAQLWCHNGDIPWHELRSGGAHIVQLPTYPFERRRCWLTETDKTGYSDSFFNTSTPESQAAQPLEGATQADIVYDTLCSILGLKREELRINEPLSRYEIPGILLLRLKHTLDARSDLRLDESRLRLCATPSDVVTIALQPEQGAGLL